MTTLTTQPADANCTQNKYSELSDKQLLNLIAQHQDREALAGLYERYKVPLGRFLQRNRDAKCVEKLYNKVMLTAWNTANTFNDESTVSAWLFGIAYRLKFARVQNQKTPKLNNNDNFEAKTNTKTETDVAPQAASLNLDPKLLHSAMAELSVQQRTIVELFYFHNYNPDEIACILGCQHIFVKRWLLHARTQLQSALTKTNCNITAKSAPLEHLSN